MSTGNYEIPSWAGKPSTGLHLDVMKESKLIQKLMIDEKKCYLFGRNSQLNDFCIDHQSCSRVHAALVYHKHLKRTFLVDLGSTHGTFIGRIRLEAHKPTQLPIDSMFHFGASTRNYIIRERPIQSGSRAIMEELERSTDETAEGALLGLPETETELDNLTEFNTAQNRRITMLGIPDNDPKKGVKRKVRITFNEDEEVINPEDIDPSVGRFRNMIETTIIPKKINKRPNSSRPGLLGSSESQGPSPSKRPPPHLSGNLHPSSKGLYDGLDTLTSPGIAGSFSFASRLGLPLPNPAPDLDFVPQPNPGLVQGTVMESQAQDIEEPDEPKKKKYAKEAWPGKKSVPSFL